MVESGSCTCPRTVRKWLKRYREEGPSGLLDRSSRPHRLRQPLAAAIVERVVELRHRRWTGKQIAAELAISPASVSRVGPDPTPSAPAESVIMFAISPTRSIRNPSSAGCSSTRSMNPRISSQLGIRLLNRVQNAVVEEEVTFSILPLFAVTRRGDQLLDQMRITFRRYFS
jgi:hypothetical protein